MLGTGLDGSVWGPGKGKEPQGNVTCDILHLKRMLKKVNISLKL
jgi:hypothetical protein